MKVVTTIILMALVVGETVSNCQTRCCQTCNDCCQTNTNCCETNTNCCETNNNCCETNSNCDQENRDCCKQGCSTKNESCKTNNEGCETTNNDNTNSNPVDILTPAPARITVNRETNEEKNNSNAVTTTLNLNNNVTHVNSIHIPITITNENHQNIEVVSWMRSYTNNDRVVTEAPEELLPTTPETTTSCQPVPILIPMPMMPVTEAPKPSTPTPGCCTVVNPCLRGPDYCTPYRSVCGGQCTHPFMYSPMNPCEGGCYKRSFGMWNQCDFGGCQRRMVDCRFCQDDFYNSFEGYRQCGGCYYQ